MPTSIVTGGTRGIGAAITRRLAREGGHVAAIYRSDDASAEAFAKQAAADGLDVSVHRADLGDAETCGSIVTEIVE